MTTKSNLNSPAIQFPKFIFHRSFNNKSAPQCYHPEDFQSVDYSDTFMPEEVTKDLVKRMHYAGYRCKKDASKSKQAFWRRAYFQLRNLIVMGNFKLVYKAVNKWIPLRYMSDDIAGNCNIVMIQAVAAFNPWKGIRFSTYAFTCLMRALSRLNLKNSNDKLVHCESVENIIGSDLDVSGTSVATAQISSLANLDKYFSKDSLILDEREKFVLIERFGLGDKPLSSLEEVGKLLNLSKERVRQIQFAALEKLRKVMVPSEVF